MPLDRTAETTITGLNKVPAFAEGKVRDLRIRWAFEEIGRPYNTELFSGMEPRPASYRQWQPFGQVPALDDGHLRLFESGAILLYLGEQDERLLPRDEKGRWDAIAWLIAALNSVEPMLMQIVMLDIFEAGKDWTREARPSAVAFAKDRLGAVEKALGTKDWLTGRFTVADIVMVTVLRSLSHTAIIAEFPLLTAYQARGESRPAFRKALADQLAGFEPAPTEGEVA